MLSALTDNHSPCTLPARAAHPDLHDKLLRIRDVQERCSMSKTAIYNGIQAGTFPVPVKVGKSSRWLASEIQGFILARATARSQP